MFPFKSRSDYGADKEQVGKGAYGYVMSTTRGYAIKEVKHDNDQYLPHLSSICEAAFLANIKSPYIVKCHDVIITNRSTLLVMPLAKTNLNNVIDHPELDIRKLSIQLCLGFADICNQGLYHFDLKPSNILLNDNKLWIADPGLASYYLFAHAPYHDTVSTLWYRAPEIILGDNLSHKADIWSIGVIIAEMILSRKSKTNLFPGDDDDDQLSKIFEVMGTPKHDHYLTRLPQWESKGARLPHQAADLKLYLQSKGLSSDEISLIRTILILDPEKRPSVFELLHHPWFGLSTIPKEIKPLEILTNGIVKSLNKWKKRWQERNYLVSKMDKVCTAEQISLTTLCLAVSYIDNLKNSDEVDAMAAIYIATCLYEPIVPDPDRYRNGPKKRFSKAVRHMLKNLSFRIISPTPNHFLYLHFKDKDKLTQAEALLHKSIYTRSFVQSPQHLANNIITIIEGKEETIGSSQLKKELISL